MMNDHMIMILYIYIYLNSTFIYKEYTL